MPAKKHSLFDRAIIGEAVFASFAKLNPVTLLKNPVIFVTEIGAAVTTVALLSGLGAESFSFGLQIVLWLWFTVLFANFAEALAEGQGRAQAESLRKSRTQTIARRISGGREEKIPVTSLRN